MSEILLLLLNANKGMVYICHFSKHLKKDKKFVYLSIVNDTN